MTDIVQSKSHSIQFSATIFISSDLGVVILDVAVELIYQLLVEDIQNIIFIPHREIVIRQMTKKRKRVLHVLQTVVMGRRSE